MHIDPLHDVDILDISPTLQHETPVWPGDRPFERRVTASLSKGDSVEVSTITTTLHIGAHTDAPSHYELGAATIDQVRLDPYVGPCWVIRTPPGLTKILPEHCLDLPRSYRRVLFATNTFSPRGPFNRAFAHFTPEALEELGVRGVQLVGIDTPSFDAFDSKDLAAHHTLARFKISNLEGLDLEQVPAGPYTLVALPLRIGGGDGSPVRAILLKHRPDSPKAKARDI